MKSNSNSNSSTPHRSGPVDAPPALLHNSGGRPPRVTISWRGLGRAALGNPSPSGPAGSAPAASASHPRGIWLQLTLSIGPADARFRRDWNTAGALLDLVEPGHGLDEAGAQQRLVDFIEAHTAKCPWPRCLLAGRSTQVARQASDLSVQIDDAATTFVALAKCTGSLWLRDRRPHLAPLHAPTLVGPGSTSMHGVRWQQSLWFAQGIPQELLSSLGRPKAPSMSSRHR